MATSYSTAFAFNFRLLLSESSVTVPNHDHRLRDMRVKSNVHKCSFVLLSWGNGEQRHLKLSSVILHLHFVLWRTPVLDSVLIAHDPAPLT
jgi:hypothetical protein